MTPFAERICEIPDVFDAERGGGGVVLVAAGGIGRWQQVKAVVDALERADFGGGGT